MHTKQHISHARPLRPVTRRTVVAGDFGSGSLCGSFGPKTPSYDWMSAEAPESFQSACLCFALASQFTALSTASNANMDDTELVLLNAGSHTCIMAHLMRYSWTECALRGFPAYLPLCSDYG